MKNNDKKVKGLGCLSAILWGVPLLIVLIIIGFYGWFAYNSMVKSQQEIHMAWADVENSYQKRLDLIPNLVNTVKGYAEHEKSTLTEVTNARAKAGGINIEAENLSDIDLSQFEAAQQSVSSSLSRLLVVVEQYPNLKANQNFMQLQFELKEIESEIIVRRDIFNNAVKRYNIRILRFPRNVFAKIFGFSTYDYFSSTEGAEVAPEVQF